MATLTSANSEFVLIIPGVFPAPVVVQGYATDDAFGTEDVSPVEAKMGVDGRVLLGPAGKETTVNVPLAFSVERNGTSVFSDKYTVPVAITPPAQTAEFVKGVDNVAIPYLGGEDIVIYVGFDNGKARPAASR